MTVNRVTRGIATVRDLMATAILVVVLGTGSAGASQLTVDRLTRGELGQASTGDLVKSVSHPEACTARLGWRIGVHPE